MLVKPINVRGVCLESQYTYKFFRSPSVVHIQLAAQRTLHCEIISTRSLQVHVSGAVLRSNVITVSSTVDHLKTVIHAY